MLCPGNIRCTGFLHHTNMIYKFHNSISPYTIGQSSLSATIFFNFPDCNIITFLSSPLSLLNLPANHKETTREKHNIKYRVVETVFPVQSRAVAYDNSCQVRWHTEIQRLSPNKISAWRSEVSMKTHH